MDNTKDLIQLIRSYPETYSNKEITKVIHAETGEYVSQEFVADITGRD